MPSTTSTSVPAEVRGNEFVFFRPAEDRLYDSSLSPVYISLKLDCTERDLHPGYTKWESLKSTLFHYVYSKILKCSPVKEFKLMIRNLEHCKDSNEILDLAKTISSSPEWTAGKVLCLTNLTAQKALTQKWFRDRLLSTGSRQIIDCSTSFFWGLTGGEDGQTRGLNYGGQVLMMARQQVRAAYPESVPHDVTSPGEVDLFSARGSSLNLEPNERTIAEAKHTLEECQARLEAALTNLLNLTVLSQRPGKLCDDKLTESGNILAPPTDMMDCWHS